MRTDSLCWWGGTGLEIAACGTCIETFGLLDKVAVGYSTDMSTTVTTMAGASRVLSV